jgi:hypothetical protein
MDICVTKAEHFKTFLNFIKSWPVKNNISYHLQYIEFLYKVKNIHNPKSTTLSLINKTIIIEYFTVIEAIIDALLCQLDVKVNDKEFVPIEIYEYTNAAELLSLARKYKVIDTTIHSQLGQIKDTRNRIHIKRPRKNQKPEYEEYTRELLEQRERMFKSFMEYLFNKYSVNNPNIYPWPWKVKV